MVRRGQNSSCASFFLNTRLRFLPESVFLTSSTSTSAKKSSANSYVLGSTLDAEAVAEGGVECPLKAMEVAVMVRVYEGSSSGTSIVRKTMFFSASVALRVGARR